MRTAQETQQQQIKTTNLNPTTNTINAINKSPTTNKRAPEQIENE